MVDSLTEALTSVQEQLAQSKERRVEERFVWLVITIILLDVQILGNMENIATPIVVLVLELIILAVLAKRMKIKNAAVILDKALTTIVEKES